MRHFRLMFARTTGLIAFSAGLAILTVVSVVPQETLPKTGMWDKAQHVLAYFMVTAAGLFAFPRGGGFYAVALGVLAYGALLEGLQSLLPGRVASFADLLANGLGVAAAAGAALLVMHFLDSRRSA